VQLNNVHIIAKSDSSGCMQVTQEHVYLPYWRESRIIDDKKTFYNYRFINLLFVKKVYVYI